MWYCTVSNCSNDKVPRKQIIANSLMLGNGPKPHFTHQSFGIRSIGFQLNCSLEVRLANTTYSSAKSGVSSSPRQYCEEFLFLPKGSTCYYWKICNTNPNWVNIASQLTDPSVANFFLHYSNIVFDSS